MSFNQHYYTNFHGHCTFENDTQNLLLPLPPPPYLIGSVPPNDDINDTEIVKCFENKIANRENNVRSSVKNVSITEFQQNMQNALKTLVELRKHEHFMLHNKETLSEIEWKKAMEEINSKRKIVTSILSKITESNLTSLQKIITKRLSKRLRQKRHRAIQKQEKEIKVKELKEKSRRIDENIQTIKNNLTKAKQQEEVKQHADIVLREVLRKKYDAKRWITKLDAMVKLRRARLNTLKGQGVNISEKEAETFNTNIETIKSLWVHKSSQYDKEEVELRSKLQLSQDELDDKNEQIKNNILGWKSFLFGDNVWPQANFIDDIQHFISLRSRWDNYIDSEGSPLPVGWVTPHITFTD